MLIRDLFLGQISVFVLRLDLSAVLSGLLSTLEDFVLIARKKPS